MYAIDTFHLYIVVIQIELANVFWKLKRDYSLLNLIQYTHANLIYLGDRLMSGASETVWMKL